ncbi:MAG TPA: hypothetical protein VIL99_05695 [Ignavibacteria bacterium]
MKSVFIIIFVLFLSFAIGCGKKSTTDNKDTKKEEKKSEFVSGVACKIDGKDFLIPDSLSYAIKSSDVFSIYAKIEIEGGQYEDLFFYIQAPLKTGDFILSKENKPGHVQYRTNKDKQVKSEYDQYWSDDGKLTLTKVDEKSIEGTFSFTATGTVNDVDKKMVVTDGKLKIKLQ